MVGESGWWIHGLTVGGVGYWWILAVVLRLDADIDSFSLVASSRLASRLDHDGHQMLG
jgi:hypothetical protein